MSEKEPTKIIELNPTSKAESGITPLEQKKGVGKKSRERVTKKMKEERSKMRAKSQKASLRMNKAGIAEKKEESTSLQSAEQASTPEELGETKKELDEVKAEVENLKQPRRIDLQIEEITNTKNKVGGFWNKISKYAEAIFTKPVQKMYAAYLDYSIQKTEAKIQKLQAKSALEGPVIDIMAIRRKKQQMDQIVPETFTPKKEVSEVEQKGAHVEQAKTELAGVEAKLASEIETIKKEIEALKAQELEVQQTTYTNDPGIRKQILEKQRELTTKNMALESAKRNVENTTYSHESALNEQAKLDAEKKAAEQKLEDNYQKSDLKNLGYTKEDVAQIDPTEAAIILQEGKRKESAKEIPLGRKESSDTEEEFKQAA